MALRILHAVELYAPSVGGAQAVVRQLSERLAARGHEVTVATTKLEARHAAEIAGVQIAEFDVRGNEVRGMQGEIERYRRFVADGEFDLVMTYAAQQWTTDALLPVVDDLGKPVILAPCGFSGLHDVAYAPYFAHLRDDLHKFAALVFHSNTYQDIRFARDAGVRNGEVIPNGADEREFTELPARGSFRARHRLRGNAPLLLTVGAHTGHKGHAQAISVARSSARMPGGALTIVGNTPLGRGCMPSCRVRAGVARIAPPTRRVILSDPPRPSVIAAYADADIFLFCSAIECSPLVLFEAMAAGLPFISVDVGNAAEIAEWSGGGVIVPTTLEPNGLRSADTAAVVRAVDELLQDEDRRAVMSERSRATWRERFTWDAIASKYEDLYVRVAAARSSTEA